MVNGKPVSAGVDGLPLNDNDLITVGDRHFRWQAGAASSASPFGSTARPPWNASPRVASLSASAPRSRLPVRVAPSAVSTPKPRRPPPPSPQPPPQPRSPLKEAPEANGKQSTSSGTNEELFSSFEQHEAELTLNGSFELVDSLPPEEVAAVESEGDAHAGKDVEASVATPMCNKSMPALTPRVESASPLIVFTPATPQTTADRRKGAAPPCLSVHSRAPTAEPASPYSPGADVSPLEATTTRALNFNGLEEEWSDAPSPSPQTSSKRRRSSHSSTRTGTPASPFEPRSSSAVASRRSTNAETDPLNLSQEVKRMFSQLKKDKKNGQPTSPTRSLSLSPTRNRKLGSPDRDALPVEQYPLPDVVGEPSANERDSAGAVPDASPSTPVQFGVTTPMVPRSSARRGRRSSLRREALLASTRKSKPLFGALTVPTPPSVLRHTRTSESPEPSGGKPSKHVDFSPQVAVVAIPARGKSKPTREMLEAEREDARVHRERAEEKEARAALRRARSDGGSKKKSTTKKRRATIGAKRQSPKRARTPSPVAVAASTPAEQTASASRKRRSRSQETAADTSTPRRRRSSASAASASSQQEAQGPPKKSPRVVARRRKSAASPSSPVLLGVRELVATAKPTVSPITVGVRELLRSPRRSTSPAVVGVKETLGQRRNHSTPRLHGVRELLGAPNKKSPESPDLSGISRLLRSPRNVTFRDEAPTGDSAGDTDVVVRRSSRLRTSSSLGPKMVTRAVSPPLPTKPVAKRRSKSNTTSSSVAQEKDAVARVAPSSSRTSRRRVAPVEIVEAAAEPKRRSTRSRQLAPTFSPPTSPVRSPPATKSRRVDKQRSPAAKQRSPAAKQRSPAAKQRSPAAKQRSPAAKQRSPAAKQRSPAAKQRSPATKQPSPAADEVVPQPKRRTKRALPPVKARATKAAQSPKTKKLSKTNVKVAASTPQEVETTEPPVSSRAKRQAKAAIAPTTRVTRAAASKKAVG